MKQLIGVCILFLINLTGFSQTDTIFSTNEKIACKVVKIRTDSIVYKMLPSEKVHFISKKEVDKIIYKNGKTFSVKDDISIRHVEGVSNFNDVAITFTEADVKTFTKIASIQIEFEPDQSGQAKYLEKAYQLLKIQAALRGGNIIFIPEQIALRIEGMTDTTAKHIYADAYCDKMPTVESFEKLIGDNDNFSSTIQWYMHKSRVDVYQLYFNGRFTINEIFTEEGIVYIEGDLKSFPKVKTFRLISVSNKSFMLYFEMGENVYNVRVDL